MLKTRVISAAIGLPALLLLLIFGPKALVAVLFLACVAVGTYETAHMLVPRLEVIFSSGIHDTARDNHASRWLTAVAVAFACLTFAGIGFSEGLRGPIFIGFLGSMLVGCFFAPDNNVAFGRVAALLTSVTYGTLPWLAGWDLYLMGDHARFLFLTLAIVWAGDTGAYFGGHRWGKHKLSQRISPNKTIEGSVAGLIASVIGALIVNALFGGALASWGIILLCGFLGGISGQMGDLVESMFKRFSGVKDSGVIIPGHGGFLDRVDGILFAAPVIWAILYTSSGF